MSLLLNTVHNVYSFVSFEWNGNIQERILSGAWFKQAIYFSNKKQKLYELTNYNTLCLFFFFLINVDKILIQMPI